MPSDAPAPWTRLESVRRTAATCAPVLTFLLLLPLWTSAAQAENWPQWRGPQRDGHAPMFQVPKTWPDAPTERWKVEVGEGFTSPIVSGDRIYLMARQGDDEVAMALSLDDGKVIWKHAFPTPYTMHQAAIKYGQGPKATPVLADGVACFLGIDARFSCHDAKDGKVLWTRDFSEQSAPVETFCGSSMSPLVSDGTLFIHLGDDRAGTLFAADLRSGEERWSWSGQGPGYASPLMVDIDGQQTLITFATTHLLGFDPQSGKLLWERDYLDKWRENIVSPIVVGERIIISDYVNGTLSLWPKRTEDGWTVEDHWRNEELTQRMASPVSNGEVVYGFSDKKKGQLFALDPATGKVLHADAGRGGDNAVLTLVGDWLLVSTTRAELKVISTDAQSFEPVKTYEIAQSSVWAHPAWLSDGLLVKDQKHLARLALVDAPPAKSDAPPAKESAGR